MQSVKGLSLIILRKHEGVFVLRIQKLIPTEHISVVCTGRMWGQWSATACFQIFEYNNNIIIEYHITQNNKIQYNNNNNFI